MAKRITSGKREREKLKQTKRQDKQKKKEERLSGGSRSFEDMLAYVDENGVLHTTPQDVKPKEEIDASQIEISVPRQSEIEEEEEPMSGWNISPHPKATASSRMPPVPRNTFFTSPTPRRALPKGTG